ncbi:MAG: FAD-dependent oxidoreductase [Thermoplasmata archaeon]|nr:FAD-dependent oxidoreductase [Thermoplasmata archaeon]
MTFEFSTANTGFRYLSQQAIRLALPGVEDPWGAARTFSLSSSPTEIDRLSVTCRISETPFKQALSRLQPGETAEVYGPLGVFLFDPSRPALFLAGGIGITPFRGMLRYAADTHVASERRLLYSARTAEDLIFRRELDEFARIGPQVRVDYSVTRSGGSSTPWEGRKGRIDEPSIREAIRGMDRPKVYVAGLPEMVTEIVGILQERLGVAEDDVDYEVFRGF